MALINIGRDNSDKFYRYKMPKMLTQIQNPDRLGARTLVTNLAEVVACLHVPVEYPVKYMGFELGTTARWDKKQKILQLAGMYTTDDLTTVLQEFIKILVQCSRCMDPEVIMKIKRHNITLNCNACGHVSGPQITSKSANKLVTYILKHYKAEKGSMTSKERRRLKLLKRKEEKSTKGTSESKNTSDDKSRDVDHFELDTSKEAILARRIEEFGDMTQQNKTVEAGPDVDENGPEGILRRFVSRKPNASAFVCELRRLRLARDLDTPALTRYAVVSCLSYGSPSISKATAKQAIIDLAKLGGDLLAGVSKGHDLQMSLVLESLEHCCQLNANLFKCIAKILEILYDKDALNEESILKWHASSIEFPAPGIDQNTAGRIRQSTQVFIDWLQEDDDESDSE